MTWKLPRFTLASALLIAGFSGGERLAKLLYPKKTSPLPDNGINTFLTRTIPLKTIPVQPESYAPAGGNLPALATVNGPHKA